MVALFVIILIITMITLDYFTQRRAVKKGCIRSDVHPASIYPDSISDTTMLAPNHIWLMNRPGKKSLNLGVDESMMMSMGDIDEITVHPEENVKKGEPLFTLAKADRTITFNSPITGKIKRINTTVLNNPSDIIHNPYKNGWFCSIAAAEPESSKDNFPTGESARKWLKEEWGKMKEAIHAISSNPTAAYMQDGGELMCGFGMTLSDEQWEEFKLQVVDSSSATS